MKEPIVYSVFAEEEAGGNPAAVVLDADALSAAERQLLARELGVPTTAFVASEGGLSLAFFTPACEVPMCGHATVAAATALVEAGRLVPDPGGTAFRVSTQADTTDMTVAAGASGPPVVQVGLFPPRFRTTKLERGRVEAVLGGVATDSALPLGIGYAGLWHLFVGLPAIDELALLDPEWNRLNALCRELEVDTLAAFATRPDAEGCYRMRDLCGAIGNREEPASGTTSGALVAHLARHGRLPARGPLEVDVRMGYELGRPSRVRVRRELEDGGRSRLSVFGTARRTSEVLA